MPSHLAHAPAPSIRARKAERSDLDALLDLEHRVFATDRLSRRSLRRFLSSATAHVIVADDGGRLAGAAVLLFRPSSAAARLYSIAVAPQSGWSRRRHAAAGSRRGGGAGARLHLDPARSADDQSRRDLPLPQERLPAVRAAHRVLRRRRRRAAVREAAHAAAARTGGGAAVLSSDHRVHLRAGLHHDGAGLGRPELPAVARIGVRTLARGQHDLHGRRRTRTDASRSGWR